VIAGRTLAEAGDIGKVRVQGQVRQLQRHRPHRCVLRRPDPAPAPDPGRSPTLTRPGAAITNASDRKARRPRKRSGASSDGGLIWPAISSPRTGRAQSRSADLRLGIGSLNTEAAVSE
jgi:hypothetical protein